MSRKLHNLKDLIILRAAYNQELHEAIENGDMEYVTEYCESYDNDDREWYDFTQTLDMSELQAMQEESDAEYDKAFRTGHRIMGM